MPNGSVEPPARLLHVGALSNEIRIQTLATRNGYRIRDALPYLAAAKACRLHSNVPQTLYETPRYPSTASQF